MLKLIKNNVGYGIISLCLLLSFQGHSQMLVEAEMTYQKLANGTIVLTATLVDTDEYDPVLEREIEFVSFLDTMRVTLGSATTDEEGIAKMEGIPFSSLLLDSAHRFFITYQITEDTEYISGEEVLSFQDVDIKLAFEEIDSVKQMVVTISSWEEDGSFVAIEEMDAYIYVPRLFSFLPIGEIYSEEEGIGMTPFPTDLPGGKEGQMSVFVRIEDNDDYGNVEISNDTNWAMHANGDSKILPRALWSPRPPMWMIISFTVLMVGVWFHYGWLILNMFKIKSEASESEDINYEV